MSGGRLNVYTAIESDPICFPQITKASLLYPAASITAFRVQTKGQVANKCFMFMAGRSKKMLRGEGTRQMSIIIRPAEEKDAVGIANVLRDLVKAGKRSKRDDPEFALQHYIAHANRIECLVAEDNEGRIFGFQSIKLAIIDNEYDAPTGWALIGTHISPKAARRGIGKALFSVTRKAAARAGVPAIEAFIAARNAEGQAYYGAMGFVDYREAKDVICKSYHLH